MLIKTADVTSIALDPWIVGEGNINVHSPIQITNLVDAKTTWAYTDSQLEKSFQSSFRIQSYRMLTLFEYVSLHTQESIKYWSGYHWMSFLIMSLPTTTAYTLMKRSCSLSLSAVSLGSRLDSSELEVFPERFWTHGNLRRLATRLLNTNSQSLISILLWTTDRACP